MSQENYMSDACKDVAAPPGRASMSPVHHPQPASWHSCAGGVGERVQHRYSELPRVTGRRRLGLEQLPKALACPASCSRQGQLATLLRVGSLRCSFQGSFKPAAYGHFCHGSISRTCQRLPQDWRIVCDGAFPGRERGVGLYLRIRLVPTGAHLLYITQSPSLAAMLYNSYLSFAPRS
jgi:hypothetical protein